MTQPQYDSHVWEHILERTITPEELHKHVTQEQLREILQTGWKRKWTVEETARQVLDKYDSER